MVALRRRWGGGNATTPLPRRHRSGAAAMAALREDSA